MSDLQTVTRLRGLALPAVKGSGGYFESKTALDVAWGDLMNTLFTPKGTRVMRRDFGSVLRDELFEPATDDQSAVLEVVIREAAAEHCPHVQIRQVQVQHDGNASKILVSFSLRTDTAAVQTREVAIPKVHLSAELV